MRLDTYLYVPDVGMARMAGCVWSILAVPLLGRASIYLMAPASQAVRLGWTYRTMSVYRGRTGASRQPGLRLPGEARIASLVT